jgi:hypothetical protein
MLTTMLPSQAHYGVVGVTWPWRDVNAESCWRLCYQSNLGATRCRCQVILARMLPSHASEGTAGATWP